MTMLPSPHFQLGDGILTLQGQPLLTDVPTNVGIHEDPASVGLFLQLAAAAFSARHVFSLGNLTGVARFTCCHRYEPFWMKAAAGKRGGEVPVETQFLLAERPDGSCVLIVPLIDNAFRAALQGAGDHGLELVAESGDPAVVANAMTGLFIAAGTEPYALIERAARSVIHRLGTGRLRSEKPLPSFIDQFGWCTWDAFYHEISHEKVRLGLESFAAGGVLPKLLILDDGWQSEHAMPSGERRLTAFSANAKFPGDLAPTVAMAKTEFGLSTFLVWHAINGYWGGVDDTAFPGYHIRPLPRNYSPGILQHVPELPRWWGQVAGVVPPEENYRFFQDYHRHLRRQGVDGVKVDNQASLEGLSAGFGGRVALMQRYHEALEGSVHTHFGGNLINCMSCANEMLYSAMNSNLTRTSTDFWPRRPESHGLHLYVNAQVSAWFGEFIQPDWDMFQSGHPLGAYHAAARALSGGPVYVSDKPDEHDFALLRKLVLPDGTVLRALLPGRPTRDCLFHDPTREDVLLKIFNLNLDAGVVGAFNARYSGSTAGEPLTGVLSPADVAGLHGDRFAVLAHYARQVYLLDPMDNLEICLPELTAEVFSIVPLRGGVAPLGLVDLFNSSAAILAKEFRNETTYVIQARGAGEFWVYSEQPPIAVAVNSLPLEYGYDSAGNIIHLTLTGPGLKNITIYY